MAMEFTRKLPIPKEVKEQYPLSKEIVEIKNQRDAVIRDIFTGKDD